MALLPVADALDRVLKDAKPLSSENVSIGEAYGRVLAEDLAARLTQPPADVSAMDGYAVRATDIASTPATLKLVGEVAAGRPFSGSIGKGETARIFTGGFVPLGADAIAIQENVTRDGERVTVNTPSPAGKHIRFAGIDFRIGDVLLRAGKKLGARDVMLAASMNHATVPVHRRPKVAILATGDELAAPGSTPKSGEIIASNSFALAAMVRGEQAEVIELGVARDNQDAIVAAIRKARAAGADVLVTTGGASVGDYDLVKPALAAEGLQLSFWKIAMRPGRPLMHGVLGGMQVLGLPGNPVSAYTTALLFLLPLIRKLSGQSGTEHGTESAVLGVALPANDERADYIRATLTPGPEGPIATPLPVQDSSLTALLAQANCFVLRDPHAAPAPAGSRCVILKLPL